MDLIFTKYWVSQIALNVIVVTLLVFPCSAQKFQKTKLYKCSDASSELPSAITFYGDLSKTEEALIFGCVI